MYPNRTGAKEVLPRLSRAGLPAAIAPDLPPCIGLSRTFTPFVYPIVILVLITMDYNTDFYMDLMDFRKDFYMDLYLYTHIIIP